MSVIHFITELPEPQREIMTILRSWILDLGPHTHEKISYKIPFFNFRGSLCYLNPVKGGVDLGFVKGYELANQHRLFEAKGRKQVRSITFYSVAEVEEHEDVIRTSLNEAAILNEYHHTMKLKAKQKK